MSRLLAIPALAIAVLASGCSSSSAAATSNLQDGSMDSPADGPMDANCTPIDSACGQPCVAGNSLGVGAFCNSITDCTSQGMANLCATLGSPNEHFCTFRCSVAPEGGASDDGGDAGALPFPTDCGEGAQCICSGSNCGCTPTMCLGK
jgi:hypothetical protein